MKKYAISLVAIIAVTTIGFLQRIADTTELKFAEWAICVGLAASLVVVEELIKFFIRRRDRAATVTLPVVPTPRPAIA